MTTVPNTRKIRGWPPMLGWPRIKFILVFSILIGFALDLVIDGGRPWYLYRTVAMGSAALLAFGLFEHWPRRLPRAIPRWVPQVLGVALAMPLTTLPIWVLSAEPGVGAFWRSEDQLLNFSALTVLGLLLAPWAALAVLLRQKDAFARDQALEFELERSQLERQAVDARLHLLRAQVAPHFLFNTLANVQALVDAGSPSASTVLNSLIAYLRAAVPRLDETATTLGQEVQLVQAYLELMHMRMPDRLDFALHVDEGTHALSCPPMSLMTLVENAVRHGIDPSETGGRIDIVIERCHGKCQISVTDTGIGLQETTSGLGTGLSTLRERLRLSFAGAAQLSLTEHPPHGVRARLIFPA